MLSIFFFDISRMDVTLNGQDFLEVHPQPEGISGQGNLRLDYIVWRLVIKQVSCALIFSLCLDVFGEGDNAAYSSDNLRKTKNNLRATIQRTSVN